MRILTSFLLILFLLKHTHGADDRLNSSLIVFSDYKDSSSQRQKEEKQWRDRRKQNDERKRLKQMRDSSRERRKISRERYDDEATNRIKIDNDQRRRRTQDQRKAQWEREIKNTDKRQYRSRIRNNKQKQKMKKQVFYPQFNPLQKVEINPQALRQKPFYSSSSSSQSVQSFQRQIEKMINNEWKRYFSFYATMNRFETSRQKTTDYIMSNNEKLKNMQKQCRERIAAINLAIGNQVDQMKIYQGEKKIKETLKTCAFEAFRIKNQENKKIEENERHRIQVKEEADQANILMNYVDNMLREKVENRERYYEGKKLSEKTTKISSEMEILIKTNNQERLKRGLKMKEIQMYLQKNPYSQQITTKKKQERKIKIKELNQLKEQEEAAREHERKAQLQIFTMNRADEQPFFQGINSRLHQYSEQKAFQRYLKFANRCQSPNIFELKKAYLFLGSIRAKKQRPIPTYNECEVVRVFLLKVNNHHDDVVFQLLLTKIEQMYDLDCRVKANHQKAKSFWRADDIVLDDKQRKKLKAGTFLMQKKQPIRKIIQRGQALIARKVIDTSDEDQQVYGRKPIEKIKTKRDKTKRSDNYLKPQTYKDLTKLTKSDIYGIRTKKTKSKWLIGEGGIDSQGNFYVWNGKKWKRTTQQNALKGVLLQRSFQQQNSFNQIQEQRKQQQMKYRSFYTNDRPQEVIRR